MCPNTAYSFRETITPVEMDHGETITYARKDAAALTMRLESTSARVLYTNKHAIPADESGNDRGNMYRARLLYEYTAAVRINGHAMIMRRYVGCQESFYEPYASGPLANNAPARFRVRVVMASWKYMPEDRPVR